MLRQLEQWEFLIDLSRGKEDGEVMKCAVFSGRSFTPENVELNEGGQLNQGRLTTRNVCSKCACAAIVFTVTAKTLSDGEKIKHSLLLGTSEL